MIFDFQKVPPLRPPDLDQSQKPGEMRENAKSTAAFHSRRAHKKSRLGCLVCKKRRIKCDETRPSCGNCQSYGASCTYDRDATVQLKSRDQRLLDRSLASVFQLSVNSVVESMLQETLFTSASTPPQSPRQLNTSLVERLHRFQTVTVQTLGSANVSKVYESTLLKIAYPKPFLIHAILAITAQHDRYLHTESCTPTPTELYHSQQATSLFNHTLSHPISVENDGDAIFATSTIVTGLAFSAVPTLNPTDSWPLRPSSDSLQWLNLRSGISLMVRLAQPWRPTSAFHTLQHESDDAKNTYTDTRPGIVDIPYPFVHLCNLTPTSTVDNNAYHFAIRMLLPLFHLPLTPQSRMIFLNFIGSMRAEFVALLEERDQVALLILMHWYALLSRSDQWWLARRTRVEGKAIGIYLERHADGKVREYLDFPAQACPYLSRKQADELGVEQPALYPRECVPM